MQMITMAHKKNYLESRTRQSKMHGNSSNSEFGKNVTVRVVTTLARKRIETFSRSKKGYKYI